MFEVGPTRSQIEKQLQPVRGSGGLMSRGGDQLSFFISTASLPVEDCCLIFLFREKNGRRDFVNKKVDDFWITDSFEFLDVSDIIVVGQVFEFFKVSDEFIDG